MEHELAARRLAEMGHPTRLAVFRLLVRAAPDGLTVGEIQEVLGVPASTLSHHLSRLLAVGLIRQEREGRQLHCTPEIAALDAVIDYLRAECCTGVARPAGKR